uniref:collagen alpha-1(I) chain-like n=1 Tax=Halichoerus grypus TaxID=9711 RepID=UPI0016592906|nr:collagen alpha-1(I) chain-like [Halichoerus grypus]
MEEAKDWRMGVRAPPPRSPGPCSPARGRADRPERPPTGHARGAGRPAGSGSPLRRASTWAEARPPRTRPGGHLAGAADTAGGGDSGGAGAVGPRLASLSRRRTFSPEVPHLGAGGAGRGGESGVPGRSSGSSSTTWPPPPPPLPPAPKAPLLRRVTMDPTIHEAPESMTRKLCRISEMKSDITVFPPRHLIVVCLLFNIFF